MSGNVDEGSRNLRQCFWAWSGQEGTRSLTRAGLMKTITAAVIDGDAASVCTALHRGRAGKNPLKTQTRYLNPSGHVQVGTFSMGSDQKVTK